MHSIGLVLLMGRKGLEDLFVEACWRSFNGEEGTNFCTFHGSYNSARPINSKNQTQDLILRLNFKERDEKHRNCAVEACHDLLSWALCTTNSLLKLSEWYSATEHVDNEACLSIREETQALQTRILAQKGSTLRTWP